MLKNISPIISPKLLKILCEMGHGDKIVIADGNFPAESLGQGKKVVRCDGHGVPELLEAILQLFPLDKFVDSPVNLMQVVKGDNTETPIWDIYAQIISKYEENADKLIAHLERFDFYEKTKSAYAIIATSEKALYANVLLQKGVIHHSGTANLV